MSDNRFACLDSDEEMEHDQKQDQEQDQEQEQEKVSKIAQPIIRSCSPFNLGGNVGPTKYPSRGVTLCVETLLLIVSYFTITQNGDTTRMIKLKYLFPPRKNGENSRLPGKVVHFSRLGSNPVKCWLPILSRQPFALGFEFTEERALKIFGTNGLTGKKNVSVDVHWICKQQRDGTYRMVRKIIPN